MSRTLSASAVSAAILGVVFISGGCSSSYDDGNGSTETQDASALSFSRTRGGHFHSGAGGAAATGGVVNPGTGGAGSAGDFVDAGAGGAPASGATASGTTPTATPAASTDVNAVIAAAQTPDGTAIPQGPGPNGQCPQVLVLLGFWSCPQIGQTCSYQASGVSHSCACDRLNGEGGLPAWVCDQ
jgi:hypothetical protein